MITDPGRSTTVAHAEDAPTMHVFATSDPCRLVRQVKEIPLLDPRTLRRIRPLPPRVAGESDSWAHKQFCDSTNLGKSSASESDSPAGRAGRGLV